jgi:hypothetical protein
MIRATTIRRIARFGGVCLLLSLVVVIAVAKAKAATRHIVVVAIEPKGRAIVYREPSSTEAMPADSGHVRRQPDHAARWDGAADVTGPELARSWRSRPKANPFEATADVLERDRSFDRSRHRAIRESDRSLRLVDVFAGPTSKLSHTPSHP